MVEVVRVVMIGVVPWTISIRNRLWGRRRSQLPENGGRCKDARVDIVDEQPVAIGARLRGDQWRE